MKLKCVFFDRDGIVNVTPGPGYVERWEDFHLMPEFVEAAKTSIAAGYVVAIATNQRGVARGIMTQATLDTIHAALLCELDSQGVSLLGIFCCTHERDSCTCRNPLPGLLLEAAQLHNIDLSASWMIGDKETDIEAGRLAGCRTILVSRDATGSMADERAVDMTMLVETLDEILS
jgi:D-glycero-D-manno-heptose 1,7-bisphosphate phosphatase